MAKGLMDRCLAREKLLDRLQERVKTMETGHNKLKASFEVQVKKMDITRKTLEETENQAEALKKVLKDKKGEISFLREKVHQAKVDGEMEFLTCTCPGYLWTT